MSETVLTCHICDAEIWRYKDSLPSNVAIGLLHAGHHSLHEIPDAAGRIVSGVAERRCEAHLRARHRIRFWIYRRFGNERVLRARFGS